jgi:hypothetical protein
MTMKLDKDGVPDMYQLKWRFKNQEGIDKKSKGWHYGIQVRFDKQADKLWKAKGWLTISDCLLPRTYMIDSKDTEIVEIERTDGKWHTELDSFVEAEHKKALEVSNKAKGMVGKVLRLGVGDGYAWYTVVKETGRKVKVEWRGFCPDRWTDQILGWGGTFDTSTIKPLCREKYDLKAWRTFPV